ncbi:unnamed protein product, partial [Mycena citricolor]
HDTQSEAGGRCMQTANLPIQRPQRRSRCIGKSQATVKCDGPSPEAFRFGIPVRNPLWVGESVSDCLDGIWIA